MSFTVSSRKAEEVNTGHKGQRDTMSSDEEDKRKKGDGGTHFDTNRNILWYNIFFNDQTATESKALHGELDAARYTETQREEERESFQTKGL